MIKIKIFASVFVFCVSLYTAYLAGKSSHGQLCTPTSNRLKDQEQMLRVLKSGSNNSVELTQHLPTVFIITPTYDRLVQKAELTRMANTLVNVPRLHWILVEDSEQPTELVKTFVERYRSGADFKDPGRGMRITLLNIVTPAHMKLKPKDPHYAKSRGCYQRNLALDYLIQNCDTEKGVIYFADDDNAYSLELFDVIRSTKRVSVFPVGLVGGVFAERPKVKDNRVIGWEVGFAQDRNFATDMAGFAINLQFYLNFKGKFAEEFRIGWIESEFLKIMVNITQLEPLSQDKILVWHTRTEKPNLNAEKKFVKAHRHHSYEGFKL